MVGMQKFSANGTLSVEQIAEQNVKVKLRESKLFR